MSRWERAADAADRYAAQVHELYHSSAYYYGDTSHHWVDRALFEVANAVYKLEVDDGNDPFQSLRTFRWLLDQATFALQFLSPEDRLLAQHMLRHRS